LQKFQYLYKKYRTKILTPFAIRITAQVDDESRKKCRLVMTLLVRDEEDIIRQNIEYHLNQGVDFIIATDNASTDGTPDILKEYEKKGVLHIIQEPNLDLSQAKWVNRMGKLAFEKYLANIIFHCDADEFWHSSSGNLKNELLRHPYVDIIRVNLLNVLLEDKGGTERFPEDARYCVTRPYPTKNYEKDTENRPFLLFPYPCKVIFKVNKELPLVRRGNHGVLFEKTYIAKRSVDIVIYHYPIRGKAQFYKKVINSGTAFENNQELGKAVAFHIKRWYQLFKEGKLDKEYTKHVLSKALANELIESEIIAEETEMRQKLLSIQ